MCRLSRYSFFKGLAIDRSRACRGRMLRRGGQSRAPALRGGGRRAAPFCNWILCTILRLLFLRDNGTGASSAGTSLLDHVADMLPELSSSRWYSEVELPSDYSYAGTEVFLLCVV